jgi:hypothetical protein
MVKNTKIYTYCCTFRNTNTSLSKTAAAQNNPPIYKTKLSVCMQAQAQRFFPPFFLLRPASIEHAYCYKMLANVCTLQRN